MSWHDVETSKGNYSTKKLSQIDNAVSLARARGINIVMDVYQSPQWASGSSDKEAPPQNPQDYANFVHAMAQRYAGQVAGWEIWNEENLGRFWGQQPSASSYASLLKAAYPAVKSGDPNAKVVFGGMSGNDYDYLEAAYAAAPDLANYFDVMAVHPYSPIWSPDFVHYDGSGHIAKDAFAGYREVRGVMVPHGPKKRIVLTEFAWPTTSQPNMGVSPHQQPDYPRLAFQCAQQDP